MQRKNELTMAELDLCPGQRQIRLGKTGLGDNISHYRKRRERYKMGGSEVRKMGCKKDGGQRYKKLISLMDEGCSK